MSKKYVIEIKPEYEDTTKGVMVLGARESNLYVDTLAIDDLEQLNSDYINEHFSELQDTAYQRGLEDGQNETWEAAKKIEFGISNGGIATDVMMEIFGTYIPNKVLREFTAAEAIEKLKAYEEKQKADDKIEVRDEVIVYGCRGVVTYVHENLYTVMMHDGSCGNWGKGELKKTGKKHDIDKILEEIQCGQ